MRPRWNPTGSRVAFYSLEQGQQGSDPYYLFDAPLGGQGSFYHNGLNPEYSPDSTMLGFVVNDPAGSIDYWHIKTVTIANKSIVSMYKTLHHLGQFVWSPNSSSVVVEESTGVGTADLQVLNAAHTYNSQVPQSIHSSVYGYLSQPTWSHDDSKIALIGTNDANLSNVILYDVATATLTTHTNVPLTARGYAFPIWSTDDKYILANYEDDGVSPNTLVVLNASSTTATNLNTVNFVSATNRDVKDWYGDYVQPPPNVLGATTDKPDPGTTNNANNNENTSGGQNTSNQNTFNQQPRTQTDTGTTTTTSNTGATSVPQVLGESTTLPETGFVGQGSGVLLIAMVLSVTGGLLLYLQRYAKET
jgi:hypothetical protein